MPNKTDRYFLIIPPVIAAASALSISAGTDGLPIDDAYIFSRYASNLAHGLGYSFNPHEISFGVTSFFWTVINAAFLKIFPGATFQMTSHAIGIGCFVLLTVLVESWILRETDSIASAVMGAILCAVSPISYMNAVSGMETMLFSTAVIGVLYLYRFGAIKKPFLMGLAAGAVFTIRPEGLYPAAAILFLELWIAVRCKDVSATRRLPLFILGFLLLAGPLEAFMKLNGPGWMPATYYGKLTSAGGCGKPGILIAAIKVLNYMLKGHMRLMAPYALAGGIAWAVAAFWAMNAALKMLLMRASGKIPGAARVTTVLTLVFASLLVQLWRMGDLSFFKALLCLGIVITWLFIFISLLFHIRRAGRIENDNVNEARGDAALAGLMILPAVYGIAFRAGPLFGGYYIRYLAVMVPAFWILAAKGAKVLFNDNRRAINAGMCIMLLYSLLLAGIAFQEQRAVYKREIALNEGLRTRAAEWIRDNTPENAEVMVGYTGLGVVGSRCGRYVLDLGALINPDIIAYYRNAPCGPAGRWDRTVAYMKDRGVSYYITVHGPPTDPHANPAGTEGFSRVAEISEPAVAGSVYKITIWRVQPK